MKLKDKLELIIALVIVVVFLGALLNIPNDIVNQITAWLMSIFVGILLSGVAGTLVESFTGDFLKKISIPIEIFGVKFSISLFIIATIVVKFLLFGM